MKDVAGGVTVLLSVLTFYSLIVLFFGVSAAWELFKGVMIFNLAVAAFCRLFVNPNDIC